MYIEKPVIYATKNEAKVQQKALKKLGWKDAQVSPRNYQSLFASSATSVFCLVRGTPVKEAYSRAIKTLYWRVNGAWF